MQTVAGRGGGVRESFLEDVTFELRKLWWRWSGEGDPGRGNSLKTPRAVASAGAGPPGRGGGGRAAGVLGAMGARAERRVGAGR